MDNYRLVLLGALVPFIYLAVGAGGHAPADSQPASISDQSAMTHRPIVSLLAPDDQILNDAGGSTTVRSSLVESGLAAGVVDAGANLDADPVFGDVDGPDLIPGTVDDDVSVISGSPAVDAGDDSLIPADRFDLDGDGDTSEPMPTDIHGMQRIHSEGGTAAVDMGAFESDATGTTNERHAGPVDLRLQFEIPHPNPVRETGTLEFRLPSTERAQIAVFDLLGRKHLTLFNGMADRDRPYRVEIEAGGLSSGIYFAVLSSATHSAVANFVVVK